MYNQSYDEYMQNILGYQPGFRNSFYTYNTYNNNNVDLEALYPEIYKIVYPMVQKVCNQNTKPITKELIDDMVNEIYTTIEPNEPININVNLTNSTRDVSNNSDSKKINKSEAKPEVREARTVDTKESRQGNFLMNDLIRILILRELLGRPQNRPPQRPPMRPGIPGGPQRPPFPGGGRPPFMQRDFDQDYNIYEY